jgi:hypothetical protein
VRALVAAMLPSVPPTHGLPLIRPLLLVFPADWWVWGQNFAQDTRWASDGKRLMSTPTSAMSSWAEMVPDPVISANCRTWAAYGAIAWAMVVSRAAIWAPSRSMFSSIIAQDDAVVVGEKPA